jgi:hypothetical protein
MRSGKRLHPVSDGGDAVKTLTDDDIVNVAHALASLNWSCLTTRWSGRAARRTLTPISASCASLARAAQRRSTKEYIMADEDSVKTPLDAMQDTLSRLKEMEHYSKTNIEKLAALWLEVSEHKEQKQYETMVDEVLKCQNRFQESITSLIEAYEEETARLTSSTQ